MGTLDLIEAAQGGPFVALVDGEAVALASPASMDYQKVLACLQLGIVPGTPLIATWRSRALQQAWAAHYDLPDFVSAQRLAYLLDRYRSALVYDLMHWCQADLGELWRSRRWRTLLDLIDHLPAWSWYSSAVFGDEEHAAMLAESMKAREGEGDKSNGAPPMHQWTPEVAELRALRNDVRALHYLIPASAGDDKAKPPAPLPVPTSPLEAAMKRGDVERRQEKHKALVARMLPHKA